MAVVGCGYWGVNYVRVFSELPGVRVAAICDPRRERLEEVGRRFPGAPRTTELDRALDLAGVDAAVICTSATTHHDVASRCLEAGKHVLVEKPMATDPADAENLIRLAEERDATLMVGHTFLYNAGIEKLKGYMARGELGRVYYLYARRTNLGPIRHDVNAILDLAPHDVSIFNHLVGAEPEWVSAIGAKVLGNHREDVGFVSLAYPDGIVGNIHVSWADPNKVRELVVVGSEKRVAFDDVNALERIRIFEKGVEPAALDAKGYGGHPFAIRDGDIISPRIEVSEPLKNQCRHFLECIATRRRPRTDGLAGLEVVRVMSAINRSIEARGAPIAVPPPSPPARAA